MSIRTKNKKKTNQIKLITKMKEKEEKMWLFNLLCQEGNNGRT